MLAEKKTEVPGIYKAGEGVLINKDMEALQAYRNRKMRERKLERIDEELKIIKEDISEIRNFIRSIQK